MFEVRRGTTTQLSDVRFMVANPNVINNDKMVACRRRHAEGPQAQARRHVE